MKFCGRLICRPLQRINLEKLTPSFVWLFCGSNTWTVLAIRRTHAGRRQQSGKGGGAAARDNHEASDLPMYCHLVLCKLVCHYVNWNRFFKVLLGTATRIWSGESLLGTGCRFCPNGTGCWWPGVDKSMVLVCHSVPCNLSCKNDKEDTNWFISAVGGLGRRGAQSVVIGPCCGWSSEWLVQSLGQRMDLHSLIILRPLRP